MALRPAKLGVSLFRHPCRTAPFPRERGILLGLPPLVPVGGYAPATPFLSTIEVFRQSAAVHRLDARLLCYWLFFSKVGVPFA